MEIVKIKKFLHSFDKYGSAKGSKDDSLLRSCGGLCLVLVIIIVFLFVLAMILG